MALRSILHLNLLHYLLNLQLCQLLQERFVLQRPLLLIRVEDRLDFPTEDILQRSAAQCKANDLRNV